MLEIEAPPLAEKRVHFRKGKWREFFDGKGDSTSGRGCTSGVQGAKAQPGEEVAPRKRGEVRGSRAVSKTLRYLAANSSALPESWQRVPYLLDNIQLK